MTTSKRLKPRTVKARPSRGVARAKSTPVYGLGALDIDCRIFGRDVDPPAGRNGGWLEQHLARAARRLGVRKGRLSVAIVGDRRMATLHQRFSNTPGTTDVLTFDLREPGQHTLEGELILCRDQARRQARRRGHDVRLELLLYAVHGLLHLLGHDDHHPAGYRRMHQVEDRLLASLGLGRVFADLPSDPSPRPRRRLCAAGAGRIAK